jgi:Tol biopolymer transport system component
VAVRRNVNGNGDIWLIDTARGIPSRFTSHPDNDGSAVWSPDGRRIVFAATRDGVTDLFERSIGDAGDEVRVLDALAGRSPTDWSATGTLLFESAGDLWEVTLAGERRPRQLTRTSFTEDEGQYSPDGGWIAYRSNESGRFEIYVRSLDEAARAEPVSTTGGSHPRWSPDGRELFYNAPDDQLMAVPITLPHDGTRAAIGAPVTLFPTQLARQDLPRQQYAVARDGRFLLNVRLEDTPTPITVVQSWSTQIAP